MNCSEQTSPASASEIVDRFTQRLMKLVDRRLSRSLGRRVDAEDVVQSVFRSFFRRADDFRFGRSGDLWRLLATMAVNKVRKQAARHGAEKRDFRRESSVSDEVLAIQSPIGEPTPDHAVAIEEILRLEMERLSDSHRRILQMRLAGDSLAKISVELRLSQRTIRRILQQIREQLTSALRETE